MPPSAGLQSGQRMTRHELAPWIVGTLLNSATAKPRSSNKARSKGPRSLTRATIVAAAIEELDSSGLATFSIRNVAARLGVYPTAVYWHIANRNLILAEIVGHILNDAIPDEADDWQNFVRQLFRRYRTVIKAHPNAAPLIGAHIVGNSAIPLGFVERLLATLAHGGFAGEDLVHAYNSVIAAMAGFVTQEFAPLPNEESEEWRLAVQDRLLEIDLKAFPTVGANLPLLANKAFIMRWRSGAEAPLDTSFDRYVEIVIAGLKAAATPAS